MRYLTKIGLVSLLLLLLLPTVTAQALNVYSLEISNVNYIGTSPPQPYFVVDVQINNGSCENLFAGTDSYHNLTTGTVNIRFYESTGFSNCDGKLVKEYNIAYVQGESYTIMIYADTQGLPVYTLLKNDVSAIPTGQTRVLVRNATQYSNITLEFTLPSNARPYLVKVREGEQISLELPAGDWQVSLLNPPPAVIPSHYFSQTEPLNAGELWVVTAAGPTQLGSPANVYGIWIADYKLSY